MHPGVVVLRGAYLKLMTGSGDLTPVPAAVIDALDSVTVTTAAGSASGFQMQFQFNSASPLNESLLLAPLRHATPDQAPLRVALVVTMNGLAQVLFDGVLTQVEAQPGGANSTGTLSLIGEDLTRMMDNRDRTGRSMSSMSIEQRVRHICEGYRSNGLTCLVAPLNNADTPSALDHRPTMQGTDLQYLQSLAEQVGFEFYVEPGTQPGQGVAYFGPRIQQGVPQAPLWVDADSLTNVESLNFQFNLTRALAPVVHGMPASGRTGVPTIAVPATSALQPPLGREQARVTRDQRQVGSARFRHGEAITRAEAQAARSQDAADASGELDVLRYGGMLRARRLVEVRGAGAAFSGLYYVRSVQTTIRRGEFRQRFELCRNSLVANPARTPS
jgi:hypothetical protein